ncbi:ATP-binding protein [Vibrio sp. NH-UV-68]|uniref:PAS domain-containing sensor histidine kinase n=1 Tax=unclassified Vibrio TaxID=2614977 RepID=UPI0036F2F169
MIELSLVKKMTSLTIIVFLLTLLVGYSVNTELNLIVVIFLCFSLAAIAFFIIKNVHEDVENKYFRYEQILDSLQTPLSVTDIDMNWTYINKPVQDLFHKPRESFIGKPCNNWGAPICKSDKCGVWRLRKGIDETYFSQFDREFRVNTRYIYNRKGDPVGHVEICTDITAIIGLEKASQIEKENSKRLEAAYEELKKTQETLIESEKMASLGSLVAGVAHEINTPIGICVTASSFIKDQLFELQKSLDSNQLSQDDLERIIDIINESNTIIESSMARSIDLVKSFRQVAVDQSSEERYQFRISENLHNVVTSLKHELKKYNAKVEVSCDPELKINSYPGALAQVYYNLIVNSLVHGFDGSDGSNNIYINVTFEDDIIHIEYKDDGCGIEQDIIRKIFEPFITTKRGDGSSGLGAHIIYNLVTHKLGGNVSCQSEIGKGCQFDIKLPVETKES